jgi:hypothetical protein
VCNVVSGYLYATETSEAGGKERQKGKGGGSTARGQMGAERDSGGSGEVNGDRGASPPSAAWEMRDGTSVRGARMRD